MCVCGGGGGVGGGVVGGLQFYIFKNTLKFKPTQKKPLSFTFVDVIYESH